jgi:hypothetical protein
MGPPGCPPHRTKLLVCQLGPRRLWEETEAAYDWWYEHGKPDFVRFGMTVTGDRQTVRQGYVLAGGELLLREGVPVRPAVKRNRRRRTGSSSRLMVVTRPTL